MTCRFEFNTRLRSGTAHIKCDATLNSEIHLEIKSVTWTFGKDFWDVVTTESEKDEILNKASKVAEKEFVG